MKITDILTDGCIRVPLTSGDKTAAITELIDLLDEQGKLADRDVVLRAILDREHMRSTGIGLGLAVPHGKSHGCQHLAMAIGKPAVPMEFDAIDKRPCTLIALLCSPVEGTGSHIQALASISRLWQTEVFRAAALEATTPADLYAQIKQHER